MRFFFYDDARVNFFSRSFVVREKFFFQTFEREKALTACVLFRWTTTTTRAKKRQKRKERALGVHKSSLLQMLLLTKQEGRARVDSFLHTKKKEPRNESSTTFSLARGARM